MLYYLGKVLIKRLYCFKSQKFWTMKRYKYFHAKNLNRQSDCIILNPTIFKGDVLIRQKIWFVKVIVSFQRGLLNKSTAWYFYKRLKTSLHKPTGNLLQNLFSKKCAFKNNLQFKKSFCLKQIQHLNCDCRPSNFDFRNSLQLLPIPLLSGTLSSAQDGLKN